MFKKSYDEGITLIETLIYLVITVFLSLGISRLISDAAASLDRASNESIAARQVIRFTNILKSDISGSKDVLINPTSTERCLLPISSTGNATYLFSAKIVEIYNKNGFDDLLGETLATYSLNSDSKISNNDKFLVRTTCNSTSSISLNSENLLNLGKFAIPVTGGDFLYCNSTTGFISCPTGSTKDAFSTYKFKLRDDLINVDSLNGKFKFATLRKLFGANSSGGLNQVQLMARKVDE